MCKYATSTYKPHQACFSCRKTFKRRVMGDIKRGEDSKNAAKCPDCGGLTANMGYDFESPKKNDLKAWTHIQSLYAVGITYMSCGCTGPGYIPRSKEQLIKYFEDLKADYLKEIEFWRSRTEPETKPEIDRDLSKNFEYIRKVRFPSRTKGEIVTNQEAIEFWIAKVREIETKLSIAKRSN